MNVNTYAPMALSTVTEFAESLSIVRAPFWFVIERVQLTELSVPSAGSNRLKFKVSSKGDCFVPKG